MTDEALVRAASDLAETIERELAEARVRPDLADVFARARALDGDAIPTGLRALEDEFEDDELGPDLPDPALLAFTGALRDEVEEDAVARTMQPTGPLPSVRQPPRRRWGVALLAVAAIALAALGFGGLRETPGRLDAQQGPASLASKSAEQVIEGRLYSRQERPRERPEPGLDSEHEHEPEHEPTSEPAPEPVPKPSLEQLELEAAQAWKAGKLGVAESKLRRIIARAGRGPKAELAYGDLFAITKQRGGSSRQSRTWRRYLQRFPQGRFSDDARAGLCMRASAGRADACWSNYLDEHPRGTHAARARRELSRGAP